MHARMLFIAATAMMSLAVAAGCDGSGTTTTGGSGGSEGGSGGAGGTGGTGMNTPAPPKLGAQVDRMGRPAINTAGNNTFNSNPEQADQAKDAYNAASDPTKWGDFTAEVQKNLAILDSLDTVCGNQLLADPAKNDPSRYATLAGALVDDRLYINTDGNACTVYLAVEADATGILANNDCGGRRLSYDVIDISYSVLAAGALSGVDDGVDISDAAKGEVFPHLAAPY